MNPLIDSGLFRLQCFANTLSLLSMFLIVYGDSACFLSSHKTLNILSLTVFGCRGWCAGRNPPFVYSDGIQLNGLPASPAELTDAYSPFHPAGQPFHRSQPHPQRHNAASSSSHSWTYRFCSGTKALAMHPYGYCSSAWWAEFPQTNMPEAVRQLTNPQKQIHNLTEIKITIKLNPHTTLQQRLYFPSYV
jgi:hypothetical protein